MKTSPLPLAAALALAVGCEKDFEPPMMPADSAIATPAVPPDDTDIVPPMDPPQPTDSGDTGDTGDTDPVPPMPSPGSSPARGLSPLPSVPPLR